MSDAEIEPDRWLRSRSTPQGRRLWPKTIFVRRRLVASLRTIMSDASASTSNVTRGLLHRILVVIEWELAHLHGKHRYTMPRLNTH